MIENLSIGWIAKKGRTNTEMQIIENQCYLESIVSPNENSALSVFIM